MAVSFGLLQFTLLSVRVAAVRYDTVQDSGFAFFNKLTTSIIWLASNLR
jgi:hypothetical protein